MEKYRCPSEDDRMVKRVDPCDGYPPHTTRMLSVTQGTGYTTPFVVVSRFLFSIPSLGKRLLSTRTSPCQSIYRQRLPNESSFGAKSTVVFEEIEIGQLSASAVRRTTV